MAWIRLDDQIAHHPKFLRSGPVCGWFFVCSLGFCQKFLTDGLIPDEAISTIASVEHPRRCAEALVKAGLFERADKGFRIHDYLQYNESAASVKSRREADRIRKTSAQNPRRIQTESARNPSASRARVPSHPKISNTKYKLTPETETHTTSGNGDGGSLSPAAPELGNPNTDPFTNRAVTERAGRFVDRYQALYPTHRKGARYAVKPARDYAAAVTLCATWADDRYLDKLAVVFLTTDHKFAEEGSRTIPQFLAIASWCDGRLREWAVREGVTL